jgi:hypothetical protein
MVPVRHSNSPSLRDSVGVPPKECHVRNNEGRTEKRPSSLLFRFFTSFLPAAFTRQSFFHALLLAGFQIKGVPLYLLDDVFLLHFTLKASECVFEGLTLLQSDLCQRNNTPKPVLSGLVIYCKVLCSSQGLYTTCGQSKGQNLP